jgi:hypothetical protein
MATRLPASQCTREELRTLVEGRLFAFVNAGVELHQLGGVKNA